MKNNLSCLKPVRTRRVLRDVHNCNADEIKFKKKRMCLKCGKKFLSRGHYNRICGECGSVNKIITMRTYSVSLKPLDEPNLLEKRLYGLN